MIGSTAVVVDSASYLPREVHARYGLITVPIIVSLNGEEYEEFVTLDAETFYERLAAGAKVATSQPSPGAFVRAYEGAKAAGAEQVVSVHIGSTLSGTVNSARLAAGMVDVPVHIIDTGQASFIEGLGAWEACEALAAGATIAEAETAAKSAVAASGNVFILRGLELMRSGGRMREQETLPGGGIPVLAVDGGAVKAVAAVRTVEEAMDAMTAHVAAAIELSPGKAFRVGISNGAAADLAGELEARVRALPRVAEIGQYVIGPAVGAHTGPGCTGVVFLPRPV